MPVHYEIAEKVATITLDRPEVKNALDQAALDAVAAALADARTNDAVWIVSIKARGSDFCVGQDVKELAGSATRSGDYFAPIFRGLKSLHKPVICSVRGLCLAGGAGIAMGSDIRIYSRTARMGWPHAKIGICSIGGPTGLARSIPVNIALELMFTGDFISADRALALGLANHVVDDDALEAETERMIEKVLANAPLAIRAAKQSTLTTIELPYDEAVDRARAILDALLETDDAREGMKSFNEKRAPHWTAR
jgi:enoyl-CoA hydratase/carnithine racemase